LKRSSSRLGPYRHLSRREIFLSHSFSQRVHPAAVIALGIAALLLPADITQNGSMGRGVILDYMSR